jgi:Protein of unknown function (DUF4238)
MDAGEMIYRSKEHHVVPITLQRRFKSDNDRDRIWFAKRGQNGEFKPPNLVLFEQALCAKNINTVWTGEALSDLVEKCYYGEIDGYLGQMLPSVLDEIERGIMPEFTGVAHDSIIKVVLEMGKRTPFFKEGHDLTAIGREIVHSTLAELPNLPDSKERKQLEANLKDPNRLHEYGRDALVRATIQPDEKVEKALENYRVRWAVSETAHSFILSNRVVYGLGNGGSGGLSNPQHEIWMPISPKVALVLLKDPNNQIQLKTICTPSHIRKLNEHAVSTSSQIASHSKELLESLTGRRALNRMRPIR